MFWRPIHQLAPLLLPGTWNQSQKPFTLARQSYTARGLITMTSPLCANVREKETTTHASSSVTKSEPNRPRPRRECRTHDWLISREIRLFSIRSSFFLQTFFFLFFLRFLRFFLSLLARVEAHVHLWRQIHFYLGYCAVLWGMWKLKVSSCSCWIFN